jgi:hypothetical protein
MKTEIRGKNIMVNGMMIKNREEVMKEEIMTIGTMINTCFVNKKREPILVLFFVLSPFSIVVLKWMQVIKLKK